MRAPDDVQAMVQMADSAMYSAKEDGKNRVHLQLIGSDVAMAESYPLPTRKFSEPARLANEVEILAARSRGNIYC